MKTMEKVKIDSRKNAITVCVARIPFAVGDNKVVPKERAEEIESCQIAKVRAQKFFAWKLLERVLARCFGLKMEELDIRRTQNGKWGCSDLFFSLSHSGNFVAVAVSNGPVGIDVEKFDASRFSLALSEKIATEREREGGASPRNLIELWTKKEAVFKLSGGRAFIPKDIETSAFSTITRFFEDGGENYFVSVAADNAEYAEFFGLE